MVKKMQRSAEGEAKDKGAAGNAQFAGTVKESASQIWLADSRTVPARSIPGTIGQRPCTTPKAR